jgi:hypothetical protein
MSEKEMNSGPVLSLAFVLFSVESEGVEPVTKVQKTDVSQSNIHGTALTALYC